MRRYLFALMALAIFAGKARAFEPVVCDPQKSPLCSGLMEWWGFGEASDSSREGSAAGRLWLEDPSVDLGTGSNKVGGSYSLFFDGDGALRIPRAGSLPSRGTVAFWYYPQAPSTTRNQILFTNDSCTDTSTTATESYHLDSPTVCSSCGFNVGGTTNPADAILSANAQNINNTNASQHTMAFSVPDPTEFGDIPQNVQITEVRVKARAKEDSNGDGEIQLGVTLDSDSTFSSVLGVHNVYATKDSGALSRPGGGAWNWGDFENLKMELRIVAGGGSRTVYFDEAYVEVTYANCLSSPGVTIYENTSSKIAVAGQKAETNDEWKVEGDSVSDNTWHLAVVTFSPFGDYGQNQVCISVDGSPLADHCSSVGYFVQTGATADWLLGSLPNDVDPNDGYIDGFGIWSRTWSDRDVLMYYNEGTGEAYPFY